MRKGKYRPREQRTEVEPKLQMLWSLRQKKQKQKWKVKKKKNKKLFLQFPCGTAG